MDASDPWQRDNVRLCPRTLLHVSMHRRVFVESVVSPVLVIVPDIFLDQPTELLLVEDDDVIEKLSTYVAHPAFSDAVLPRALVGSADGLDSD